VFSENETDVNLGVYRTGMAERMVRTRRWKYTYSFCETRDGQLYDLEADPHEMNNRFHDPGHAAERRELEALLRGWQRETGDYFKLPD
jgi:arylsulfatase A-like enzyme